MPNKDSDTSGTGAASAKSAHAQQLLPLEAGTTPVPTALLDRVMPTLRDTELRVLLVVVRQTLGWLTQSQLMRRTGRASGAVARAIDALVQSGLIDVLDAEGKPLATPAERRRCLGRLYFRLRKAGGEAIPAASVPTAKSEHAKPHTTKKTVYKNKQNRKQNVDNPMEKPLVIRSSRWVQAGEILTEQRKARGTEVP